MRIFGYLVVVMLVLALLVGVSFALTGADLAMFKFWAPKYEDARRQVFEQTKSYNQGMIQELQAYYLRYQDASPSQQAALRDVVLHQFADYDQSRLPAHLYQFMQELQSPEEIR